MMGVSHHVNEHHQYRASRRRYNVCGMQPASFNVLD